MSAKLPIETDSVSGMIATSTAPGTKSVSTIARIGADEEAEAEPDRRLHGGADEREPDAEQRHPGGHAASIRCRRGRRTPGPTPRRRTR